MEGTRPSSISLPPSTDEQTRRRRRCTKQLFIAALAAQFSLSRCVRLPGQLTSPSRAERHARSAGRDNNRGTPGSTTLGRQSTGRRAGVLYLQVGRYPESSGRMAQRLYRGGLKETLLCTAAGPAMNSLKVQQMSRTQASRLVTTDALIRREGL